MDFSKLLAHPDKEEIVSKLVQGTRPKDVTDWLKLKYPDKNQSHLRLSAALLKQFLDNNLDLYQKLKEDIVSVKEGKAIQKQIADSLLNSKSYKERLNELANEEIDVRKVIKDTGVIIQQRVEQYFDKMQENPGNLKPDYGLIKWMEILLKWSETFYKIVEEGPDQRIEHNITVQMIDQYTALFQEAIRETLAEMDAESAFLFMEKFNEKMELLKPPAIEAPITPAKKMVEAQLMAATITNATNDTQDLIHQEFSSE